jgi:hypothetical protein
MLSIAHSAKRVSTKVAAFVAPIIFTTVLCPVLASASNIELLSDCANSISQDQSYVTPAQVYTDSCRQPGNDFGSIGAWQNTYAADIASDSLDLVQLDVIATDLYTGSLLSGNSKTGSSEAVSDANASDNPDRVPESPSVTLICVGLVAGLGMHLRKTISRNTPFGPEPSALASSTESRPCDNSHPA